jgi:hypothetical protein
MLFLPMLLPICFVVFHQQRIMRLKNGEMLLEMITYGLVLNRIIYVYNDSNKTTCTSTLLHLSRNFLLDFLHHSLTLPSSMESLTISVYGFQDFIKQQKNGHKILLVFLFLFKKKGRWTFIILMIMIIIVLFFLRPYL